MVEKMQERVNQNDQSVSQLSYIQLRSGWNISPLVLEQQLFKLGTSGVGEWLLVRWTRSRSRTSHPATEKETQFLPPVRGFISALACVSRAHPYQRREVHFLFLSLIRPYRRCLRACRCVSVSNNTLWHGGYPSYPVPLGRLSFFFLSNFYPIF